MNLTKKCNKCKKVKDVSNFYKRNDRNSYRYICKPCDNIESNERRKKSGWISEKKRQGKGSKHSKLSKINSQKHRDKMSDMYIRGLITKKSKDLKPKDIPAELVELYRLNLKLKRLLRQEKE
jgi:hypothetical protein